MKMCFYERNKTEVNFMDSCDSSGPSKKCGGIKKNHAHLSMIF